jgi:hypothetical protein
MRDDWECHDDVGGDEHRQPDASGRAASRPDVEEEETKCKTEREESR